MAPRNHNRTSTTPPQPDARRGNPGRSRHDRAHQDWDPLGKAENMALAESLRRIALTDYPWGSSDPFGRLSQVGRAAMEQTEAPRVQGRPSAQRAELVGERAVDYLLGLWGCVPGSHRSSPVRIRVLDSRRERPVPRDLPDGLERTGQVRDDRVRDSVRTDRRSTQLLRALWLGPLGLRLGGPVKTW